MKSYLLSVWLIIALVIVPGVGLAEDSAPQNASPPGELFARTSRSANGAPRAFETSIASYNCPNKVVVDLISAVHVGEVSYYVRLNEEFKGYDAVLYELIAPDGTKIEKERPGNPISFLQRSIQTTLGLDFQLDIVDYKAPNFVHADLSPEKFVSSMFASRVTAASALETLVNQSRAEKKKSDPVEDLKVLIIAMRGGDEYQKYELRSYVAQKFAHSDEFIKHLDGLIGDAIVQKRNARAITVLKEQLKKGKKKLSIFYGAAHMPDMAERLQVDLKCSAGETRWLTAWCLVSGDACKSQDG